MMFTILFFTLFLFIYITPVYALDNVVINEIFPNPPGGGAEKTEFIELFNSNDEEIDINGWSLDDISDGGSKPYTFKEQSISQHGFLVIFKKDSGIALNNGGDTVRLLDKEGKVVDSYEYDKVEDGETLGRSPDGADWFTLIESSPGKPNKSVVPTQTPFPTSTPNPSPTHKQIKPTKDKAKSESKSVKGKAGTSISNITTNKHQMLTKPVANDYLSSSIASSEMNILGEVATNTVERLSSIKPTLTETVAEPEKGNTKRAAGITFVLSGIFTVGGSITYWWRKQTI